MDHPTSIGIQQHFDGISKAYYEIVDRIWYDVGYYHRMEAEFVRRELPHNLGLAIDAGCGPGRHTALLASASRWVVAVDVSVEMLKLTRQRVSTLNRRVDLIQADIRQLPFKGSVASFVLNLEVLEHLPGKNEDVRKALDEFKRVLVSGAGLITEARLVKHSWWRAFGVKPPSWKEVSASMRQEYYERHPLTVGNSFREETIDALLRSCGFKCLEKAYIRVLPAGLIERYRPLGVLDSILEKTPVTRRLAREAIWHAKR